MSQSRTDPHTQTHPCWGWLIRDFPVFYPGFFPPHAPLPPGKKCAEFLTNRRCNDTVRIRIRFGHYGSADRYGLRSNSIYIRNSLIDTPMRRIYTEQLLFPPGRSEWIGTTFLVPSDRLIDAAWYFFTLRCCTKQSRF